MTTDTTTQNPGTETSTRELEEIISEAQDIIRSFREIIFTRFIASGRDDCSEQEKNFYSLLLISALRDLVTGLEPLLRELENQHAPQLQSDFREFLAEHPVLGPDSQISDLLDSFAQQ